MPEKKKECHWILVTVSLVILEGCVNPLKIVRAGEVDEGMGETGERN